MDPLPSLIAEIAPWYPLREGTDVERTLAYFLAYLAHVLPGEAFPASTFSPDAALFVVAAQRAALREVWEHRAQFKQFATTVGGPVLRAHGLDGALALVCELERSVTLPVELVADATALKRVLAPGGGAAAGTVEGGGFVLHVRAQAAGVLHLRLVHLRLCSGATCVLGVGVDVAPGAAASEMVAVMLSEEVKGALEGGRARVVSAHLVAVQKEEA